MEETAPVLSALMGEALRDPPTLREFTTAAELADGLLRQVRGD